MKKSLLGIALAVIMTASLAACGGSDSSAASSAAASKEESTAAASTKEESSADAYDLSNLGLTLATNNFGQGEYSLDLNAWIVDTIAQQIGSKSDIVDNQFTVDNIITNLRSQLSANPDGVTMIGIAETVFPAIQKACDEAGVPYSFFCTPPIAEDVAEMEEDPLYAGTVLFDAAEEGSYIAREAYEDGCRKAVLLAGALGDFAHDQRIKGFTETFESLGGKVLDVARCDNPGQGDEKGSNLLSANRDADCGIGIAAGYITSLEGVRDKMGLDYKIYGCDTTPNLIQDVVDGKVEVIAAGGNTAAAFGTILLINKILGHPILDERGKAPYTNAMSLFYCDRDNCVEFQKFWDECQRKPLTDEEVLELIGPDVTYEQFIKALEDYADNSYAKIEAYK